MVLTSQIRSKKKDAPGPTKVVETLFFWTQAPGPKSLKKPWVNICHFDMDKVPINRDKPLD